MYTAGEDPRGEHPRLLNRTGLRPGKDTAMKITITNKKLAPMGYGTWYTGTVDGCWFQAKVYDQPSTFGIHEGRISKLLLRD